MSKIIVEPKSQDEFLSLEAYLKQKGIFFITEEEYRAENQKRLMHAFAQMLSQSASTELTNDEIDYVVEQVRTKRYEANRS